MKVLITLIFIAMTNIALSKEPYVVELVVYKVKPAYQDSFHDILEDARRHIQKFPGMITYRTFRSTSNELIFIDFVKWESLELAVSAAKQVEKMTALKDFMQVFEEIKFMDHFEQYTLFNQHEKVNLVQTKPDYYKATDKPILVDIDQSNNLMISGVCAPEDEKFLRSIEAIYAVAYTIKSKYKDLQQDFVVPKMEAQWWVEGSRPFDETPKEEWNWNIMIPMPDFVKKAVVENCIAEAVNKKDIAELSEVEFNPFNEGKSVQVLHIGSYDEEQESIGKIMKFISEHGLEVNGYHHEIYLSDPMKTPVEKLRTILRYPVK